VTPGLRVSFIYCDLQFILFTVDLFALTRQLVDIESITGNEAGVGELLDRSLSLLDYDTQRIPVEENRFNLFATPRGSPRPVVVFSTHMDVVPPWLPSSEDEHNIYGRGSCDAKGIIAAQIGAAERLRTENFPIGLLFVVGEERNSVGAIVANAKAHALHGGSCKFLINGEPTDNKIAVASKGGLRVEVTARGKLAHSAYPHLGDSAIDKLLTALERLRQIPLPQSPEVGPCNMNIGVIEGGHAPNVIADHARAQLLYRLVGPSEELRKQIVSAAGDQVQVRFPLEIPFLKLRTVDGIPTMIAAFTTDIPALTNWGEPVLLGPGSIHVAHTEREFVAKQDLLTAVELYCAIVKKLL
jgi:acetylornithine deacetylase